MTYDTKLSPYSGIDEHSFVFKPATHNVLTTTSDFPSGNTYVRLYTYTYNSFGLPKNGYLDKPWHACNFK